MDCDNLGNVTEEIFGSRFWFLTEVSEGRHDAFKGYSKKDFAYLRFWMHIPMIMFLVNYLKILNDVHIKRVAINQNRV